MAKFLTRFSIVQFQGHAGPLAQGEVERTRDHVGVQRMVRSCIILIPWEESARSFSPTFFRNFAGIAGHPR